MKLTCTKVVNVPFTEGKKYAAKVEGKEITIIGDDGYEWLVEPYLGNYAILVGGMNFQNIRVVAKFKEDIAPQKHLVIKS